MNPVSLSLDTPHLASKYEERSADRQFRHGRDLVAQLAIQEGETVLDIGCGTGLLAEHVADLVGASGAVLGIDPLPLRIEIANRKARPNLAFAVGNAYALDRYPSLHFDVVYLNAVFHWFHDKEEPLREIHRLLKPNGRLGIATGSKEHQGILQKVKQRVLERDPYRQYAAAREGGPYPVSSSELSQLLEGVGFRVSKIELQDNVQFQPNAQAAIDFFEASSFGNFLGHLPKGLRSRAAKEIAAGLNPYGTPDGIRLENKRIVALARKPNTD